MILMLVIVVNNNFKNLIVAAAILEDETEATFAWVLQELKNSCDIIPTALYSDADPSLISAIKKNYSETQHFHCIFHIDLNLRKKLKGKMHAKFLAMCNSLCPKKFEIGWEALINEFYNILQEFYILVKIAGQVLLSTKILLLEFKVHNE